jgi:hypothetical protein
MQNEKNHFALLKVRNTGAKYYRTIIGYSHNKAVCMFCQGVGTHHSMHNSAE